MLRSDIKPNVRTYTALITALGNARQWERALDIVARMKRHGYGAGIEPNAYTYSGGLLCWRAGCTGCGAATPLRLYCGGKVADGWQRRALVGTGLAAAALRSCGSCAVLLSCGQWAAPALTARRSSPAAALLKTMGEQGKWAMAEQVFSELEAEQLALMAREAELDAASSVASLAQGLAHPPEPSAAAGSPASSSSSSSAIAAAAAAVAALVAAQRGAGARPAGGAAAPQALQPADDTESVEETAQAAGVVTQSLGAVLDADLDAASVASEAASPSAASASPSSAAGSASAFSYFGGAAAEPAAPGASGSAAWTTENAALQGLQLQLSLDWGPVVLPHEPAAAAAALPADYAAAAASLSAGAGGSALSSTARPLKPLPKGKGPVNEVVCGALMLAYERGSRWEDAVRVLGRARALGIAPNTIMYNTAMSALGKAGQADAARALFDEMAHPGAAAAAPAAELGCCFVGDAVGGCCAESPPLPACLPACLPTAAPAWPALTRLHAALCAHPLQMLCRTRRSLPPTAWPAAPRRRSRPSAPCWLQVGAALLVHAPQRLWLPLPCPALQRGLPACPPLLSSAVPGALQRALLPAPGGPCWLPSPASLLTR